MKAFGAQRFLLSCVWLSTVCGSVRFDSVSPSPGWWLARLQDYVIAAMAKIISTIKAILTRIIFSAHSLLAIWHLVIIKEDHKYWTLCGPLLLLLLEGIFTIMIKKTQEWRW